MQQKQDSIQDYSYTAYVIMSFGGEERVMEADTMFKKLKVDSTKITNSSIKNSFPSER